MFNIVRACIRGWVAICLRNSASVPAEVLRLQRHRALEFRRLGVYYGTQSNRISGFSAERSMPKIKFVNEKKEVDVEPGANLRQVALQQGIQLYPGFHKNWWGN